MKRTASIRVAARVELPPTLALVVHRALHLLDERRPSLVNLAALVEIDPVLTGAVLRVVRCPIYAVGEPIPELAESVEMIGRVAMERILRSLPVVDDDDPVRVEKACRRFTHGVAVAAAARWISNQGAYASPDEAYLAGLVHDVGGLVAPEGEDPGLVAIRTETIVKSWRLGPRVAAVARWHHSLAEGVSADSLVLDGSGIEPETARLLGAVGRGAMFAAAFGHGCSGAAAAAPSDDPDGASVREAIELELAHAADLLGLPSTTSTEFASALFRREVRMRYDEEGDEPKQYSQARTAQRVASLHRELLDGRSLTGIPDMLDRGLRAIHEKLEFDRLVLLEPDPSNARILRARFALDPTNIDFHRGMGGVEIPIEPEGAVARAIETQTACRGADFDHDALALDRLGVSSFAVAPFRAGAANLGVVVADQFFTGRPVTDGDAAVLSMLCSALGLAMENAALDAASRKLRALAEKDELTGINNRRNALAVLQREIDRARRYGKPLSLAMIDVDHFKSWNDLHGHQVGDEVLQAVAQLITSCSRDIDAVGRYGGEEFLVVLPETPVDHAVVYAERLRATIEAHGEALRARYADASLSVSIGLSTMSPRGDDADKLIHRADTALYAAKAHGRNRVCIEMSNPDSPRPPSPPIPRGVLDEL